MTKCTQQQIYRPERHPPLTREEEIDKLQKDIEKLQARGSIGDIIAADALENKLEELRLQHAADQPAQAQQREKADA